MADESIYVERPPAPALAGIATSVWVQRVGSRPHAQRHTPHGGGEVRCVIGAAPRLLGPLTTATHQQVPAGATVVGVRLRPGVLPGLVGFPAEELVDLDVAGADLWRDTTELTDQLGDAGTAGAALHRLQAFVARSANAPDPVIVEAARQLMPRHGVGPGLLPSLLSISDRQLRRRCRAAVGVGPKELHRILRFHGFNARVLATISRGGAAEVDLARWAVDAGYHDQAHLTRECRRLLGVTPGEMLAQAGAACAGHDHAASYVPSLRPDDGRSVQERSRNPS